MGLFTKKPKAQAVLNYTEVEQGFTPPTSVVTDPLKALEEKLNKALKNQEVMVGNQQVILDAITETRTLILSLAEESTGTETDPTEEEVQEAVTRLRKEKKKGKKT